jgi:quinol monooxygenase YgiN
MSNAVSWNLQLSVKEGQLDNARKLIEEMISGTRDESGARTYECFLNPEGTSCHFLESYTDSDATMIHLGNFGSKYAEQFLSVFQPTALYVYGEPSDAVRSVADGFGAQYLGTIGGFRR